VKLELRGITKRFGPLVANDHIDLVVEPGQIHCLLGENGAGKSTLMNVLYGLYQPDEGEILIDDVPVTFSGPGDAIAAGIGMVHQHFMLIPVFTVTENVVLGHEDVLPGGFLDHGKAREQVIEVSQRYRLDVPPDALVADIAVGVQQRVEIIKALIRDAKVLILDEPTAVLTPQEIDELLAIVRRLRDGGTGVVFITHKLKEVQAVADKITVLRRGKVVGSATPDTPIPELAAMMVGRAVRLEIEKEPAHPGEPVLDVQNLRVLDPGGAVLVDDVSFSVRGGEIFAIAGVQGNGQTELTEAIIGLVEPDAGRVLLDGRDVTAEDVHGVLAGGVGYVPEDRLHDGLVGPFSVAENLVLDLYDKPPFGQGLALNLPEIQRNAEARVSEFDVRTSSVATPAGTLSGGNQQKVVLAREMSRPLRLLVVSQPTRGLDVGSMEFVHRRIVAERDRGTAVVLVSTELDEVLGLADRIAVMYRGRIIGELPANADAQEIGLLMAGQTHAPGERATDGAGATADQAARDAAGKNPDEPAGTTKVAATPQEGR
jgi:general nucleoside transport system ATP-binding protein